MEIDGFKRDGLKRGGYISRLLFNRIIFLVNLESISRRIFQHLVKSDSESEFPDKFPAKDLVSI